MTTTIKTLNNISCAVVYNEQIIINDVQTALDFIMTIKYETECDRIALYKEAIKDSFFILSTGMAGEVLQKFITYKIKFAIIGDFSGYTSKPLKDFMYECNKGKDIFFVSTEEQAIEKLAAE